MPKQRQVVRPREPVMAASPEDQRAGPNSPTFISFCADISMTTAEQLIGVVAAQVSQGVRDIHLLLSTPGGSIKDGITLYNMLRGMPINLTTHNTGQVNSIGNVIFLAGATRYACRVSSFMFHGAGFNLPQAARFEEKDLSEKLDAITNDTKLMTDIICDRTKIDAEEASSLFLRAAFMRADKACEKGLVHEIREVNIPEGAPLLQLAFKR